MGGHPVLSFAGDFLLRGARESCGSAIRSIELYAHLRSRRKPTPGDLGLAERFEERLKTFPLARFKRKQCFFEIAYLSNLGDAEELFDPQVNPASRSVPLALFRDACHEIAAVLSIIGKRIKSSDDFDVKAFGLWLKRRLDEVPASQEDLEKTIAELRTAEEKKRERRHAADRSSELKTGKGAPKLVALDPDDYAAQYLGRTKDGRQFFLTTPFVPASTPGCEAGREFLALYVFDRSGVLLSATIDDLGPRATLDEKACCARRDELLASLGEFVSRRIRVAPSRVERFGVQFGFIPQPPEGSVDQWCVTVEPGDYMCFWPPWNSGEYDT